MDVDYYVKQIRDARSKGFWRGIYAGIALNVITTTLIYFLIHK